MQILAYRRALLPVAGLAGLLLSGGCSLFGHDKADQGPVAAGNATAGQDEATPAEPETVTSNLPEGEAGSATTTVIPDATATISAAAPKSHVVQRGDTLWGLASMFLKDPWAWPEIWYLNPEVANPHRIYPGDTLRLATGSQGQPQLLLTRGTGPGPAADLGATPTPTEITRLQPMQRSDDLAGPIATIPYASIAAFLSRPGVVTKDEAHRAPYVLALRDGHMIAGDGNTVYVKNLPQAQGQRFKVMHLGKKLKDPDGGGTLGYQADFTAIAQVTRDGKPASALLSESERETLAGDILVPEAATRAADLLPHVPQRQIHGRIVSVVNGVLMAGQYQIIAINRGTRDGVEPGHVLRVNEDQKVITDRCARIEGVGTCGGRKTRLPTESVGTLLVFRSYEHVSFALIASSRIPLRVGDHIVNP
jgi:LysM repeat protein